MKSIIINNKKKIMYYGLILVFIINFFSHKIIYSWDSSVYLGMSLILGTSTFKELWLPIRGISFPLLLRLFEPFGYQNKYLLLLLTFIFYIGMLYVIYLIGKKLDLYKRKEYKYGYLLFIIVFIILNPFIFVYYHLILTEFVIMTLNMLFVYLMYNYIRLDIRKDKKSSAVYVLIMSFIIVFLYHTKQSFIGMMLIELGLGILLSFIRYFDIKNIIYRIITCIVCIGMLIGSIKVWNIYTNNKGLDNLGDKAVESYTNKNLIGGITKLREVTNSNNLIYNDGIFTLTKKTITYNWSSPDNIIIKNENEKNEMIKVLNGESKYKRFSVYQDKNNSNVQYVLFAKNNYSMKEQLPLYFKIFYTKPGLIIGSYLDGMYDTIMVPGYWSFENRAFVAQYFYRDCNNVSDIAPGYEFAVEDLMEYNTTNMIDHLAFGYSEILSVVYKFNQMLMPLLFVIVFIMNIYIVIINKKDKRYNSIRDGFDMIVLLYGMAFGCILSYIMFRGFIDRYLMPSHIPMFIGDNIFILYLIKFIKLKKTLK